MMKKVLFSASLAGFFGLAAAVAGIGSPGGTNTARAAAAENNPSYAARATSEEYTRHAVTSQATSYPPPSYTQTSSSPSSSAWGYTVDSSVPKKRTVRFESEKDRLTYWGTENNSETPLSERADVYGTYDVYFDGSRTNFCFLHGTNLLCSLLMLYRYPLVKQANAIPQAQAQKIGLAFVREEIGDISGYVYRSCSYTEEGYYCFEFDKKIAGYDTDDELYFWVTGKGTPIEFSTWKRARYDKYKNIKVAPTVNQKAMDAKLASLGLKKYTLNETFLTLNDSGVLQLVDDVSYFIPTGTRTMPDGKTETYGTCDRIDVAIDLQYDM